MPSSSNDEASQPLLPDSAPFTENPSPLSSRIIAAHNKGRQVAQEFLSSRAQHYTVLGLVSFDLLGIFADIIISLSLCEADISGPVWGDVRNGLGIAGLVFSCLFMVELVLSIWAFGWGYFNSWFHSFDASVIVAGFVVDVLLHGVLEEVASLVVILRLWRFFKIIEEFSVGAEEQMDGLELRIEQLEAENESLKAELKKRKGMNDDEEADVGFGSGSSK